MSPIDRRIIEAALPKKGFEMRNGDHRYYHLLVDGKETGIATMISKGSGYKTYSDPLLARMALALHLSKKQLISLISCEIDHTEYIEILRNQEILV